MGSLNNLAVTATNSALISTTGALWSTLQTKIANGGRDQNCKFYYNDGAGGSLIQVIAKTVTQGAVNELKDLAQNSFNSLLSGKRNKETSGKAWVESELKKQETEEKEYGKMKVDGGTVFALDEWGYKCPDALMLGIELDHKIRIIQDYPNYKATPTDLKNGYPSTIQNVVDTNTLVWYDTTAIVNTGSSKNVIISKVTGRDYSRKELASNGDIEITVNGQISSGRPDLYPTSEFEKFFKVMQYKGVVRVNNQVLNEMGITHIIITQFNLNPRQGYKALQPYTFQAIGLQPEKEIEITEDTVTIIPQNIVNTTEKDQSEWIKMLNNQLEGLKSFASDAVSQGLGLATGLLDNVL